VGTESANPFAGQSDEGGVDAGVVGVETVERGFLGPGESELIANAMALMNASTSALRNRWAPLGPGSLTATAIFPASAIRMTVRPERPIRLPT
jgi:hypothetical protein